MNHLKVYFLAYFMQNSQKLNMVGYTASNMWPKRYGGPCTSKSSISRISQFSQGPCNAFQMVGRQSVNIKLKYRKRLKIQGC